MPRLTRGVVAKRPRRELRYKINARDGVVWSDLREDLGMAPDRLSKAMRIGGTSWFYYENPESYLEYKKPSGESRINPRRALSPTVYALGDLADSLGMELYIEFRPKVLLGGLPKEETDG